jgi:hypothetical protein
MTIKFPTIEDRLQMLRSGQDGGFVALLADAYNRADSTNAAKLREAFPHLFVAGIGLTGAVDRLLSEIDEAAQRIDSGCILPLSDDFDRQKLRQVVMNWLFDYGYQEGE